MIENTSYYLGWRAAHHNYPRLYRGSQHESSAAEWMRGYDDYTALIEDSLPPQAAAAMKSIGRESASAERFFAELKAIVRAA